MLLHVRGVLDPWSDSENKPLIDPELDKVSPAQDQLKTCRDAACAHVEEDDANGPATSDE